MSGMNLAILVGRVGKDPDIKTTQSGKTVATLSLATSRKIKDNEITQWHRLVAWEKTAEILGKYVTKGSQIAVRGEISYRDYDDADGNKKYITEINVNELTLLGSKGSSEPQQSTPKAAPVEEDIPF